MGRWAASTPPTLSRGPTSARHLLAGTSLCSAPSVQVGSRALLPCPAHLWRREPRGPPRETGQGVGVLGVVTVSIDTIPEDTEGRPSGQLSLPCGHPRPRAGRAAAGTGPGQGPAGRPHSARGRPQRPSQHSRQEHAGCRGSGIPCQHDLVLSPEFRSKTWPTAVREPGVHI